MEKNNLLEKIKLKFQHAIKTSETMGVGDILLQYIPIMIMLILDYFCMVGNSPIDYCATVLMILIVDLAAELPMLASKNKSCSTSVFFLILFLVLYVIIVTNILKSNYEPFYGVVAVITIIRIIQKVVNIDGRLNK